MKKFLIWVIGIGIFVGIVKLTFLSHASECQRIQMETTSLIQSLATCTSNNDCIITSFSCPFGCSTAINRSRISEAHEGIKTYNKQCMMVCPDCPKLVSANAICEEGVCKVENRRL